MKPGDASGDPAATGVLPMRNASGDPAATGVLPMTNASGDPAESGVLPTSGPRMNPSVDTAGRPVERNEFPGLTDEEAEIIRGLRGGPDVGERESVKPAPDRRQRRSRPRPLTDEAQRQILPGEPGSGTEAGAVPKRELPEGALPDITVDTDKRKLEDDELEFTPKADLVLGEGEFSPETHRMVPGTGNNQTGFEIMKRD